MLCLTQRNGLMQRRSVELEWLETSFKEIVADMAALWTGVCDSAGLSVAERLWVAPYGEAVFLTGNDCILAGKQPTRHWVGSPLRRGSSFLGLDASQQSARGPSKAGSLAAEVIANDQGDDGEHDRTQNVL